MNTLQQLAFWSAFSSYLLNRLATEKKQSWVSRYFVPSLPLIAAVFNLGKSFNWW